MKPRSEIELWEVVAQFRAKAALGFSDCLVLEIARKACHVPLGTFDSALAKLEGTHKIS
ncbi:MAG: hypothetical protein PHQ58_20850 [Rhodoferax sp.]|uniref:hypothetical protein n=1 Tax=Rhodoferax sp. TaxID=50421 RepID=UPI00261C433D|nr:hypothetical protein [Rhodoferax sp.]MDD2882868.1 hypothetical protein [Rhodoferax sp.]